MAGRYLGRGTGRMLAASQRQTNLRSNKLIAASEPAQMNKKDESSQMMEAYNREEFGSRNDVRKPSSAFIKADIIDTRVRERPLNKSTTVCLHSE